jgi:O-antigen biosynthesis protein
MIEFSPEPAPLATLVIIGLREAPLLLDCLASVVKNTTVPYEVIVVLNDPTPESASRVEAEIGGASVHRFRANLGFAAAANFAANLARGEYIVLLNDDCVVSPDWLFWLLDTERRRPQCAVVGSTYLHQDGSLQEAGSVLRSDGRTMAVADGEAPGSMQFERRVDYCSGGALLVRRDVWEQLGGLDEGYYPAYYEDIDFCLAAAEAGWEVWYQPRSVVTHVRSVSTNQSLRALLFERGRETFVERWSHELTEREASGELERAVWKAMGQPIRVLVIDDRVPEPRLGAGFGRMYDMLATLDREPGIHVSLHPRQAYGADLPILGVRIINDLESHLATRGVDYDVVVVSRPHNGEIFREMIGRLLPGRPIIYDAEALFHQRLEMQAAFAPSEERAALVEAAATTRLLEKSLARWADHVVCISEAEATKVRALADTPVHVVGPRFDGREPTPAPYRQRADIGMVAGWTAGPGSPNSDGLLWFAKEVMPKVQVRLPGCRLLITGDNPPDDVRWLAGPSFEFVGGLRDLAQFYNRIRLAISPTRFGAGVKLKTVEAIQYGVPIVSTSEGAAGLSQSLRRAVWVAESAEAFAEAVVSIASDRRVWDGQRRATFAANEASQIADSGMEAWPAIIRNAVTRVGSSKAGI